MSATAQGTAIVEAQLEGMTGGASVIVTGPSVYSLLATPSALEVPLGMSATFGVMATLSDGTQLDVTSAASYASGDETVANIDSPAVIQAVVVGSTFIRVEYDGVAIEYQSMSVSP